MAERNVPLTFLASTLPGARVIDDSSAAGTFVSGLAYDSRRVKPGFLFVAVVGEKFDGHQFIHDALDAGAAAIVMQYDRVGDFIPITVPKILVPYTRQALAALSCAFYDDPTEHLFLAGITGTNGKTTTARMIDSIARAAGDKTGVIGTLGTTIAGRDLPGDRTTPESSDLQEFFAEMLDEGVKSAAMEVASHALSMGRTDGCAFDVGIFTNLTQDHLDFHQTMDLYREAKSRLFTEYAEFARARGKNFVSVLNIADEAGQHYARITQAARTITYAANAAGKGQDADIAASDVKTGIDRITYRASTPSGPIDIALPFGGGFNVENSLAAIGYGIARGLSNEVIAAGLANCPPVPGRFQPVHAGQEYAVLVDYAHTPDGLENVLRSARPLTANRLIVVFGCGGNRDRTKRPKMGKLALELADVVVVTSDNPRHEDPEEIIDEIFSGMEKPGGKIIRRTDRRSAIARAMMLAQPGDTVVIAGKGHENYQIVGDTVLPFDDVVVAREEIQRAS